MTTPRVSIVIPVYRRERLVADAIESALAQTFDGFEVVVVDNASPDGTYEVCRAFAARDPRVRVFRNETNIGPVRNWRRGIEEARGEFVKLLFSDDCIAPQFLARTVKLLDSQTAFVVTAAQIVSLEDGKQHTAYSWHADSGRYSREEYFREMLLEGHGLPVSPGAALFRKSDALSNLLDAIPIDGGHDASSHGAGVDLLLYLKTATQYPCVVFVAEPLSIFRAHRGSFSCDGLGGAVSDAYAAAEVWFASENMSPAEASFVWAGHWGRRVIRGRHHRFLGRPPSALAAARSLGVHAFRMVRRRWALRTAR